MLDGDAQAERDQDDSRRALERRLHAWARDRRLQAGFGFRTVLITLAGTGCRVARTSSAAVVSVAAGDRRACRSDSTPRETSRPRRRPLTTV